MADPDLQLRPGGGGNRSPKKIFFQPFRASFWSKKKWGRRPGPPGPSAGSATAYGPAFFFLISTMRPVKSLIVQMSETRRLREKPYKGHVFDFLDDLTGGLVLFWVSSYFFPSPASFTLAPTYETINRINRSTNYQGDVGLVSSTLCIYFICMCTKSWKMSWPF